MEISDRQLGAYPIAKVELQFAQTIHHALEGLLKAKANALTRTESTPNEQNGFGFSTTPVTPAVEAAGAFSPTKAA
jgi:hypothetical protein